MCRSAGFTTRVWQIAQRNVYEPVSSSEQTRTMRSLVVSSTSPQSGQLARIFAIGLLG